MGPERTSPISKSRFTEEQIAIALRQADAGTPVGSIWRKLEITETTFSRWENELGSLGSASCRCSAPGWRDTG